MKDDVDIDDKHDLKNPSRYQKVMHQLDHGFDSPCLLCSRKITCDDMHQCKRYDRWFNKWMEGILLDEISK